MHSVELQGNGPPLLMLHGWGRNLTSLRPLAELLTPIANPLLVDLPGFGDSPLPPACWSTKEYGDHLIQFLDDKKIKEFSLLGHSFGGKVALSLALKVPERVKKLILIAPSGLRPKKKMWQQMKHRLISSSGKLVKSYDNTFNTAYFSSTFAPKFGSRDYKNAGAMKNILVKTVNEDLSDELPKIETKTLILWGEQDLETPLEAGKRFAKLIPRASFFSFPYHDHDLFQDVGSHLAATYITHYLKGK